MIGETPNGKGSQQRTVTSKTFRDNYDNIFPRPVICPGCKNEIDPETCHCGEPIGKFNSCDNHSPIPIGCNCFRAT